MSNVPPPGFNPGQRGPAPPPPPAIMRGPPVPPAQFRHPGPPGGPGGPGGGPPGPGGPPMQMQMQMPMRPREEVRSTRTVDITPMRTMDEATCLRILTTYDVYTMRKVIPINRKDKATWAKVDLVKEPLTQDDVKKQVNKLNGDKRSVADKKGALFPFQQGQVNRLLDDLNTDEQDQNFVWTLVQLDTKVNKALKETTTITVIVKHSVREGINPMAIHQMIERNKQERIMQQAQMHPQSQAPPGLPPGSMPMPMNRPGPGGPGGPQKPAAIPVQQKPPQRTSTPRISRAKPDSPASSDTESDSDMSRSSTKSSNTSLFTDSTASSERHGRSRRDFHGRSRSRHRSSSRHRARQHERRYFEDGPRIKDSLPYGVIPHSQTLVQQRHSPEPIPTVSPMPPYDPVAAAYRAGQVDGEFAALSLARQRPVIRAAPRVPVIEQAPGAVVSYQHLPVAETHYSEPQYAPRYSEARYSTTSYGDRLPRVYDDIAEIRAFARDEAFRREEARRQQAAEDYMRPPPEVRVFRPDPHPFARRQYSPPPRSLSDGW